MDESSPERLTIPALKARLRQGAWKGCVHAQIESLVQKQSANGKPYYEVRLRDGLDELVLRAWSDSMAFATLQNFRGREAVEIRGDFYDNTPYGPDARGWTPRLLDPSEAAELLAGSAEELASTQADYEFISETVAQLADPRLRKLCEKFLERHSEKFRRAAAARSFHHARRGGLCAHTAQMLRSARQIVIAYPELNADLLFAGVLFHDCGKLWETCPSDTGFDVPVQPVGELLGHITIGIELINRLWMELEPEKKSWESLSPPSEEVRLHLLHLVASHHGELEFGSPVEPRTPEAIALHYIDNLDAKLEMMRAGYLTTPDVAPGITDRVRPLNVRLARPLAKFLPSASSPAAVAGVESTPETVP